MGDKPKKLSEDLLAAAVATIENISFQEVEFIENPQAGDLYLNDMIWAVLPVRQPRAGQISLELPHSLGKALTQEIYGPVERETSDALITDVIQEVLNIIGGRFLTGALDSQRWPELGLPENGRGEMHVAEESVASVFLRVAGSSVRLRLFGKQFLALSEETGKALA